HGESSKASLGASCPSDEENGRMSFDQRGGVLVEEQSVPDDEDWEFAPGELVEVTTRSFEGGMLLVSTRN
ncbi:hypothetical protein, partial [Agrobacterium sp. NPDC089420]|uniref:hypothetical protein n=1 Tax=Agrobacterium sp. NPDC089420 TaxID=3363918 RepID=UPI00384B0DB4